MSSCIVAVFLAAESILYGVFLLQDIAGHSAGNILFKYSSILLCLGFSFLCARRGGDRLVFPALALTALADLFLLVLGQYLTLGVLLFLGVQMVYLIRLRRTLGKGWHLLRSFLPFLIGAGMSAVGQASPPNLLAGLYFSQLAVNTLLAWQLPERNGRLFAAGLTLFVGCDLCVGIFNTPALFPASLYAFARVGMWLFYLPSQVLISLSALPKKGGSHETE